MTLLILATQDHVMNGNLNEKYLVPVFDALANNKEYWIDAKEFTGITLSNETTKTIKTTKPTKVDGLTKLIKMIEKQCTVNDYLAVELDNLDDSGYDAGWTHYDTIFNRLAFEHNNHTVGGYSEETIEEGWLTEKQSDRYANKIATFIVKYAEKYCNPEHTQSLLKEFK